MKKFYLILKILLILGALITLAYLVTPPDSEVILKRPWLNSQNDKVDICENCQKDFGDLKIEVKNIKESDYIDTDGIKQYGNVAEL